MVYIGTSGWQYRHWRLSFYPKGVAQARWLEFYADRFQTVELNNSFYRLPSEESFTDWRRRTPDDFVFAVKMSRFLTHQKRLRDPAEPVELFLDRAKHLGSKLGPVLVQLPPSLEADPARLREALKEFPETVRVAVEFRHASWFNTEIYGILESRGAALCLADSPRRKTPFERTADWGFVRFHEGQAAPRPCYGERALKTWARRLSDLFGARRDVYAYFNNDRRACALRDASVFARLAEGAGLEPSRVTAEASVGAPDGEQ